MSIGNRLNKLRVVKNNNNTTWSCLVCLGTLIFKLQMSCLGLGADKTLPPTSIFSGLVEAEGRSDGP